MCANGRGSPQRPRVSSDRAQTSLLLTLQRGKEGSSNCTWNPLSHFILTPPFLLTDEETEAWGGKRLAGWKQLKGGAAGAIPGSTH